MLRTKEGKPCPADVQKTAMDLTKTFVPYMSCYRALNVEHHLNSAMNESNFQLIGPYLEELARQNPGSVAGFDKDSDTNAIKSLHFFPNFMNESLQFVRPVISLDACHLKSLFLGTLYIASVLSGHNEVYPVGFMISEGNEDGARWTLFLEKLKEACPIICEAGRSINRQPEEERFVFISDRDKGLIPALFSVFPDNVGISCARHIESNVAQKFGQQCAQSVCRIAKTFSTRYANQLIASIAKIKPEAAEYIENVEELWRSTSWLELDANLPPRYGIVTSNTSECVNNMLASARSLPWLDATDKIIDIMTTRICQLRTKHAEREPSEVVPRVRQILKKRWESANAIDVIELQVGCGDFKTSEPGYLVDNSNEENPNEESGRDGISNANHDAFHIVKPDLRFCSCGVWQDVLFPCRHACAVFRKWKGQDLAFVTKHHVHPFYTFDYVQKLFKNNVFPVVVDTIRYDGITQPPASQGRRAGRPRTKRIRRRSEILDPRDSPIICSKCGLSGHNIRTCGRTSKKSTEE